jgi:hypothetical protein
VPPKISGLTFTPGGSKPVKRPKPKPQLGPPAPVAPAPSLQTVVKQQPIAPLKRAKRQADRRVEQAVSKMANPPRLLQVPALKSYTPRQKQYILVEQGKRLTALAKHTGLRGNDLRLALPVEDQRQVALFAKLARERYAQIRQRSGAPSTVRALPAPKGTFPSGAEKLAAGFLSPKNNLFAAITPAVSPVVTVPTKAAAGIAQATYEDPLGVAGKTAKGTGELALGAVAAIPELATGLATHPGATLSQLARQLSADLSRRYGPLTRGSKGYHEFVTRLKAEGVAPELSDALAVYSVGGTTAGRTLGMLARRGTLGTTLRTVSRSRPALRVAAGKVVEQDVSRNLFRALAQHGEDVARGRALARRDARATDGLRGLRPGDGEVVKTTIRGQNRAQRREIATLQSRAHQALQAELGREVDRGAIRGMAKLSSKQRRVLYDVLQGVVTPDDPVRAVAQLTARRARIVAERARRGVGVPARVVKTNDELRTIDFAIKHADEIFTPKLAAFQAREAARSGRLAVTGVRDVVAERRVLLPQGDELGVSDPIQAAEKAINRAYREGRIRSKTRALEELHRRVGGQIEGSVPGKAVAGDLAAGYSAEVRAAARKAGLPEPAFVTHAPRPQVLRSDRTVGSGNRAVAAPKSSSMSLHRTGRADQRAEVYAQSLSRTIKRKHNWDLVDREYNLNRVKLPNQGELRKILRRQDVNVENLSIEDNRRILDALNLDPKDYAFYNPGRLRAAHDAQAVADTAGPGVEHGDQMARGLAEAVDGASVPAGSTAAGSFRGTAGWRLVTKAAHDEIHAATRPSGLVGRGVGKVQGLTSRLLLGTSPSWLQMQVAANGLLTGFGLRGNLPDLVKAQIWFHRRLTQTQRDAIDQYLGQGAFQSRTPHIGAAAENGMVDAWRAFKTTPLVRRASLANPLDAVFRADNAQNKFFKRTLFYNSAKRDAYRQMGNDVGLLIRAQEQVANLFKLGPQERLRAIVDDPAQLERHAQSALDVLGDYTRYTDRERRYLQRGVLFYGFLRYATRTLFYTLPVKHPIVSAASAELAKLHNQEVRDLLGPDVKPWDYARMFLPSGKSIDLGRINPVTNPVVNVATEGPKALGGLMSPLAQSVLDQIYGEQSFSGVPFPALDNETRARIFANTLLSTITPYREAQKAAAGGRTTRADSLPWSVRPTTTGRSKSTVLQDIFPFIPRGGGKAPVFVPQSGSSPQDEINDAVNRVMSAPVDAAQQQEINDAVNRVMSGR